MKKLLKYWNQNRQKILITVGVIVFLFICIQVANNIVKMRNQNKNINEENKTVAQDVTKPSESILTDNKVNEKRTEENARIIQDFVAHCNNKKIEEAYSLLSDDCKQEIYSNSNIFAQNYIAQIFNTQKSYKLELWAGYNNCYTYRITYLEGNALQTGGYNTANNFIDYITVVKQGQDPKLNISKLVMKQTLNKTGSEKNIEIKVNSKVVYIDYENYNITVKNGTNRTILLNDGKTNSNSCIIDEMNNEYVALINEIPMNTLTINAQYQKTFNLKFSKMYNADSQMRYMQFKDIYLDKEKYDQISNSQVQSSQAQNQLQNNQNLNNQGQETGLPNGQVLSSQNQTNQVQNGQILDNQSQINQTQSGQILNNQNQAQQGQMINNQNQTNKVQDSQGQTPNSQTINKEELEKVTIRIKL